MINFFHQIVLQNLQHKNSLFSVTHMLIVIDLGAFNSMLKQYESHQLKCIILTEIFVPVHQQLECHLFLIKLVLFQFGCHDNHENLVIAF